MIQVHDEQLCYVEHLELYPTKEKEQQKTKVADGHKDETLNEMVNGNNERGENLKQDKEEWILEQRNKKIGWKKQPEQVWDKVQVPTVNQFGALEAAEKDCGVDV
ncbi:hypothetical protein KY285_036477 [Solanum tuberosum]|nr:hypothetical protein KY289_036683 [Solanum tuberosum]KAH0639891.1 hypothetical protein KY285_036477 [Solanum tuberosum]